MGQVLAYHSVCDCKGCQPYACALLILVYHCHGVHKLVSGSEGYFVYLLAYSGSNHV